MAEPGDLLAKADDLLEKADALMARHRLGQPSSDVYPEIPVLHEVLDPGAAHDDLPVLTELAAAPVPDIAQADALAQNLRATLLTQLQPAFDRLIEAGVKQRLEPLIERILGDVRGELQLSAREILSEAISSAIEQELERRKSGG